MRTIHDDLITAQKASSIQPAILAVFTCANPPAGQTATYTYSFSPLVTTNRIEMVEYHEEPFDDYARIMLRNNDLVVPNLVGYYVDLGIGANCSGTLRYGTYPRLWVKNQHILSGATKGQRANLKVILELQGVWNILKEQLVLIGTAPKYQDENGVLAGKTIYGILEYLIETALVAATGINFTLDALGDQDDTLINALILEPTHDPLDPFLNRLAPDTYETYIDLIERLLALTGCYLRTKDGLAFKVIYPQSTDAINENYYSSLASGHVFYENTERRYVKIPNHVKVFSDQSGDWSNYFTGEAYTEDYNPPGTFIGQYIKVTEIISDKNGALTTQAMATQLAEFKLAKHKAETFGGRIIVPHDARVELYDRVGIFDTRGE